MIGLPLLVHTYTVTVIFGSLNNNGGGSQSRKLQVDNLVMQKNEM